MTRLWQALVPRARDRDPHRPVLDNREIVRLARSLPITDPFDLDALLGEVSRMVGTPIALAPYPAHTVEDARRLGEALPAALCIVAGTRAHVLYRTDTTPSHQRHSILHEVGHLLCRHGTPSADTDVRTLLRSTYDDAQEQAAEAFAYEFERRLGPVRVLSSDHPTDEKLTDTIERAGSILEG
ncbi:ImmA/IrrE family metallo-endopeptidase [Saccharothrix sp. BKS2]|uniref:ImmA/IrrE family metallo-endopeptidase n=1 Tax=Saccharothrix sp. BKS2 TaxID=3064400 RepID=UPI0039E9F1D0